MTNPDNETFTDQEGGIWSMAGAKCPTCNSDSRKAHRVQGSGYFNCYECGTTYDEPNFEPFSLIGILEEHTNE